MSELFRTQIQMLPIAEVHPYPQNAKLHSDEQVEKIAAQITQAGWDQPIVLEPDHTIIKGHGRFLAAKKLGLAEVPVIVTDLSKAKARAIRIADNKVAESPWDDEALKLELDELAGLEELEDLSLTAFDEEEIQALTGNIEPTEVSEDQAFESVNNSSRKETRQMTFFLSLNQISTVQAALEIAYKKLQDNGVDVRSVPNKSGIALSWICEKLVKQEGDDGEGEASPDQTDRPEVG